MHQMPISQAGPNALHLIEASSAKIQIYTLGTLQVVRDSTAVTESDWHTRQARQLLKILLTERPRPVSTDVLIEILWPHSTPSAAATTLRSAINALRNVLEPDRPNRAPSKYIVTQAPGYAFHLTQDIWLDVEEFERRLTPGTHAQRPGAAALFPGRGDRTLPGRLPDQRPLCRLAADRTRAAARALL